MLLLASSFSIFVKDIHDISYSHLVFFPLVIDTCLELSAFEMNEQNELLITRTFLLPYVATHDSFGRLEKLLLDFIQAKMYCEYVWIIMSFSFQTYMYQKWLKLCTHTHNIWVSSIGFYRKWQPFAHGNQRRRPSYIIYTRSWLEYQRRDFKTNCLMRMHACIVDRVSVYLSVYNKFLNIFIPPFRFSFCLCSIIQNSKWM